MPCLSFHVFPTENSPLLSTLVVARERGVSSNVKSCPVHSACSCIEIAFFSVTLLMNCWTCCFIQDIVVNTCYLIIFISPQNEKKKCMVLFNEKRPCSLQLNGLVQLWFLIRIVKNYFPKIATLRTMLSSLLKALTLQTEKKSTNLTLTVLSTHFSNCNTYCGVINAKNNDESTMIFRRFSVSSCPVVPASPQSPIQSNPARSRDTCSSFTSCW